MNLISATAMLSQSLVTKKKKKAATVYSPPLLKLVICCVTYWRKDDKILLSLVWNTTAVFHIIQVTDSYNCPASKTTGAVSTEAWVAVMILYSVMKRVLQHQQFMTETFLFCFSAKFVLVLFMSHTELSLHRTENCDFERFSFSQLLFYFYFSWI